MNEDAPRPLSEQIGKAIVWALSLALIALGAHELYARVVHPPLSPLEQLEAEIAENNRPLNEAKARCKQVLLDWLESQKRGRDGREFWADDEFTEPVRFYAVRSWEVVDQEWGVFNVRVASSTKAGFPIEVLWKVRMLDVMEQHPRIYSVEEAIAD